MDTTQTKQELMARYELAQIAKYTKMMGDAHLVNSAVRIAMDAKESEYRRRLGTCGEEAAKQVLIMDIEDAELAAQQAVRTTA